MVEFLSKHEEAEAGKDGSPFGKLKTVAPPDKDFAAAYGAPNSHNFYSQQLVQYSTPITNKAYVCLYISLSPYDTGTTTAASSISFGSATKNRRRPISSTQRLYALGSELERHSK
jgi:hypothetical protein